MTKKAVIFDLDNTIYPVSSISRELFASLFHVLEESGELIANLNAVKNDIQRKPFQVVAADHGFSEELTRKCLDLLKNLRFEGPIEAFPDFAHVPELPVEKFLVTSGFEQLQQSKISGMRLEKVFAEVHIVDVERTTKKAVFAGILERRHYSPEEVLVVGDDPESEIRAAQELGIPAVLYNKENASQTSMSVPVISDYCQLKDFL